MQRVVVTADVLIREVSEWSASSLDDYLVVQAPARRGDVTQTGVVLHLDRASAAALRDLLNEVLPGGGESRAVLANDAY